MKVAVRYAAVAAMCVSALVPAAAAAASPAAAKAAPIEVRVNQVGYPIDGSKVAFAMLPARTRHLRFTVTCNSCGGVEYGFGARDVGSWSARYKAVYKLNFSGLTVPGRYRIKVTAGRSVGWSPWFRIGAPGGEYHRLVLNAVRYFTSERDGGDVVHSVLNREPANRTDRHAYVYGSPRYDSNDNLLGKFHKIAGPVNVAGGWFDAGGGYEKFAYTGSYADGLLLTAARDFPGRYATLGPEAQFGLNWLKKLWRPRRKVLYVQVGIGSGNASNTIQGDYNFWFLPQAEDQMNVRPHHNPGPTAYFVKYRPVFRAAPPGKPISPDLAGRFAAAFGLAAQLSAGSDRSHAEHMLALARGIYAMAKTTDVGQILTAFPHDYYPGTQWKSDMLWGADEITLADQALHAPAARVLADLAVAERWARAYVAQGHPPAATPSTSTTPAHSARATSCVRSGTKITGTGFNTQPPPAAWRAACWLIWRRRCGSGSGGRRATRSSSVPRLALTMPRRTRSACTSPTRCTGSTAGRTGTAASHSSS